MVQTTLNWSCIDQIDVFEDTLPCASKVNENHYNGCQEPCHIL